MRRILLPLLLCLITGAPPVATASEPSAHNGQLIEVTDLQRENANSSKVLLLLVSQEHCPYCVQIKQEILAPMVVAGDFRGQLLIRELSIDPGTLIRDFEGREVTGSDLALRYDVDLTPTQLFLAPDGSELSERIIGIQTPELFYLYVKAAVEESIARLQRRQAAAR